MTAREFLKAAEAILTESGCPDPKVDCRRLLEDALSAPFSAIRLAGDVELTPDAESSLFDRLRRRAAGEPLQYIEGFQDFYGLRLMIDHRALIPRQDTETLAESAIKIIRKLSAPKVLDLCTGSGALALAIKAAVPGAAVMATDISGECLSLAMENASRLNLSVDFFMGDLFLAVGMRRFDVIVSNPPYLSAGDMECLQREVRREPYAALAGGTDGLDFYRRIARGLEEALNSGGHALLEVGAGQAEDVSEIFRLQLPRAEIARIKDLNGIDRVVSIHHIGG